MSCDCVFPVKILSVFGVKRGFWLCVDPDADVVKQPELSPIRFNTEDEAVAIANASNMGLAGESDSVPSRPPRLPV